MKCWSADETSGEDFFKVIATTAKTQFATMALKPEEASGEFGTDHPQSDQYVFVLEGTAQARVGQESRSITKGDVVLVPAGAKHQFKGTGSSIFRSLTFYGPVAYPGEAE